MEINNQKEHNRCRKQSSNLGIIDTPEEDQRTETQKLKYAVKENYRNTGLK